MKKKVAKFSVLPIVGASIFFYSFTTGKTEEVHKALREEFSTSGKNLVFKVPAAPAEEKNREDLRAYPLLGRSYLAFKEALGFQESGGDYHVVNEFGYMGKYQFGSGTLEMIGIQDTIRFLRNPTLQEAAFYANTARNKWILRRDIARFENEVINGIKITESGILAAAHLAGAGNVKKFLRSGGQNSFRDGFGTSIKYYFRKFGDYDTSSVIPEKRPEARVRAEE